MSAHLTAVCDNGLGALCPGENPEFGRFLETIEAACKASDELLHRYYAFKSATDWQHFEPYEKGDASNRYVKVAPDAVVALGKCAMRFHMPIELEYLKRDTHHFLEVRRYFEVLSRLGSGWVLYAPCHGMRDRLTGWAFDGLTLTEIVEAAWERWEVRPRPIVKRARRKHRQRHARRGRPRSGIELYEDWFEDLRTEPGLLGRRRGRRRRPMDRG